MSSGGDEQTTTTTTNDPPSWAVPYFQSALNRAGQLANQPYTPYTGQQVAGLTADQTMAADLIRQQATNQGALNAGSTYAQNLLGGQGQFDVQRNQFAGQNPHLDQMIASAQGDVTRAYTDATLPALMSQFNAGGAYGGSAHQQALSTSQRNLADQLSDVSMGLRSQDYDRQAGLDESYLQRQQSANDTYRQNQLTALGQLPSLNQAGYYGAQQLGQQGAIGQVTNQSQLDADYNTYVEGRDWSANRLGLLGNILGTIQGGTSSQTGANPNYRSAGQNAATAATIIAALYGGG